MNEKLIIYTDGGARGNPGPAGAGVVIYDENKKLISKHCKFLGKTTNNQAEYEAVLYAIQEAKKIRAGEIDFYLDSELLVGQLSREFKIKNMELGKYFIKIWNVGQCFKKINYHYIPREENKEADKLVNQAINDFLKK
ncbi:MAG: ribonuclease HI family protein [Ignavibacterium sp.]|nr:ribonuclease HI family protein [Ignavibacterium sp.]